MNDENTHSSSVPTPPSDEPPRSAADLAMERDFAAASNEPIVSWGRISLWALGFLAVLIIAIVLIDRYVMPWYVKLDSVAKVPSVVGLPYDSARVRLARLGFQVRKNESRFDNTFPAGAVMMQLPYGGAETKEGRRIYLTVSRGTELIPVRDLIGTPVREARISMVRDGFELGEVTYDYNDSVMKDLVYAQSLPPRVGMKPGTTIDIMISRGPRNRQVLTPNLLSLTIDEARARLEAAGLLLGIVRAREDKSFPQNSILEQSVAPYAPVGRGTAVDITVSGSPDEMQGIGEESEGEDSVLAPVEPKQPKQHAGDPKKTP